MHCLKKKKLQSIHSRRENDVVWDTEKRNLLAEKKRKKKSRYILSVGFELTLNKI